MFIFSGVAMAQDHMQISSSSFKNGGKIPQKYTCDGQNISPALSWSGIPTNTKSLVLIVDDPDAPRAKPFVHWVVFNIDPTVTGFKENEKINASKGINDYNETTYKGPCPPPGHGVHHYHFKLYALDTLLTLKSGATKDAVEKAMKNHVLAQAEIVGTYER